MKNRLRVSENSVLRIIFGPKRKEVAGGWRRLHNQELHNFCDSLHIIRAIKLRRMTWVGNITRMGEIRNACRIFIRKTERRRPFARARHR
jgi:hypothetical protein